MAGCKRLRDYFAKPKAAKSLEVNPKEIEERDQVTDAIKDFEKFLGSWAGQSTCPGNE